MYLLLISKPLISLNLKMIVLIVITLVCAFGSNFPSIEASTASGTLGNLAHGTTTPPIAGPLLNDVLHGINNVFCSLLGPKFLVSFGKHNSCPYDYEPHAFDSFKNYCQWLKNGGPELQNCVSAAVSGGELKMNGVIDVYGHIGKCCNIPNPSTESKFGGQVGDGLLGGEFLDYGLVGKLTYGAYGTANDLVCSLLEPRFLHVLVTNECPSDNVSFRSNDFGTLQSFCEFLNSCSPDIQKCFSDAAIRILIDSLGIGKIFGYSDGVLGLCCAHYSAKKPEILPPTREPTSP